VTLATFMEVLATSIANVALPTSREICRRADEYHLGLTSYLVRTQSFCPLPGWFSGLIGRKRFYMTVVRFLR